MSYNAGEARLAVVPDASGFKARTEAALRKIQIDFAVQVDADTTHAAQELAAFRSREAANAVNLRVDVDTARAQAQIAAMRRSASGGLGQFGGGALPLNAGLLGLNLVPGAALGIAQLAGALQQLAQAAFVVPGAIGGAVASIGTLAVGVSGVKDAYDAVSKAAQDSGQSQAQQARQASAAQNAHRNATVDNAQAHKDLARAYRDARQEITDLNIEVRGGVISEKQAINDALRARRDLATGQYQDALDYADAQLRVEAADQRVVEARQRNIDLQDRVRDSNARGISGSDQVVAAQERLVRSQQAVADSQANLAAVTSQGSALQQKAAEEMAKLAPNAREFVDALIATKSARDEIRASAQQPLFAGLAAELRELTDGLLPSLTTGVGGIATALNRNIRQLMQSMGSDNSRGLLDRILGNTADAHDRFTRAIDPLVRGIGTLVAGGSDALPRIADGIGTVAERFAAFIEAADKDGRLDRWINEGIDGFTDLGNILLNLGKSFTAITEAVGGNLLSTLSDLTGRMATFLNSAEGQQSLRDFFQQAREDLERWRPILESLPGLFRGLMDGAREWAGIIIPPLAQISSFLADHPPLIAAVVTAFAAWKTIAGVAGLIDSLNKISTLLGVTIPRSAASGAAAASGSMTGLMSKLGPIAAAISVALALNEVADVNKDDFDPTKSSWTHILFGPVGDWINKTFLGGGDNNAPTPGGTTTGLQTLPGFTPPPAPPPPRRGASTSDIPTNRANPTLDEILTGVAPGFIGPRETGGPTPSGRGPGPTGGWYAEIHDDEWILPKHARRAIGDKRLWDLTRGRRFQTGGYIDQYGNPITPGAAPGPAAAGAPAIAPNPYQGGGVPGILGSFVQGLQGPIGNAVSLGGSLVNAVPGATTGVSPGAQTQHGLGITAPAPAAPSLADRMATVPGLWGLVGSAASSNPAANVMAWGQQTANWLGGWASNTLTGFGSALWQGALGFFGLENSILSPNNPWNQAGQQTGQFFLSQNGPFGALLGGAQGGAGAAPQMGQQTIQLGDGSTVTIPTFGTASGTPGGVAAPGPAGQPGALTGLPTRLGGEGGLQVNTINVKRAVEAMFPQIQKIGGYRKDALKWHPNGLAIDVMIPGGDTHNGANPEGKAIGDRIYAYVMANKEAFGVDYVLWQTDSGGNHYDHLHINTTGGGYPNGQSAPAGGAAGGGPSAGSSSNSFYSNWYPATHDVGGRVPPGLSMVNNRTGGDEYILNRPQALEAARALEARRILPTPPPRPGGFQEVPDARTKQLPEAVPAPAEPMMPPSVPSPPAPSGPAAPTPVTAGAAPQIAPATPGGTNHNLKAIDTAIASGASTIGNIASMAVQAAAAAGTMGASAAAGAAGGMGAGAAGSMIAGGVQQVGKILSDVVNVGSSFLVGSVPGSFGGPPGSSPYGQPVRAEQNAPVTAATRGGNSYTFNGMDIPKVFQELDVREAQAYQAELANK